MGCFWPPRAASASPRYTKARRVAESRSATETMCGRSGLKIVAIGPSIHTVGTSHCRADLRRPPAHRFTLRVSATRRDTKGLRPHEKTRKRNMVRYRVTSTVSPPFHLSHLIHLIGNRRASGFSLNFRFSINESCESGETVAHGVTFPSEAEMAGK